MFEKGFLKEEYYQLNYYQQAEIAIAFIEYLSFGKEAIPERKIKLLESYLLVSLELLTQDPAVLSNPKFLESFHHFGARCLVETNQGEYDALFDAIGYLYLSVYGVFTVYFFDEEPKSPLRKETLQSLLKESVKELLSSSITILHWYHLGHLSEDEANIIGYKLIKPCTSLGSDATI